MPGSSAKLLCRDIVGAGCGDWLLWRDGGVWWGVMVGPLGQKVVNWPREFLLGAVQWTWRL